MSLDIRQFLRDNGFEVGARGRFSAPMIALINEKHPGVLDGNGKTIKVVKATKPKAPRVAKVNDVPAPSTPVVFDKIPTPPIVRQESILYALTPVGRSHAVIGYSSCQRCRNTVNRCACNAGPKPPAGAIPVTGYPKA